MAECTHQDLDFKEEIASDTRAESVEEDTVFNESFESLEEEGESSGHDFQECE